MMFEDLGMLLGGDPSALGGMFQGLGGNPLEMLMRVSNDPAMREAFLNKAAASPVSPNVFSQMGGMPTGPAGPPTAPGGMVPPGPTAGMMPPPPNPMMPPGSAPNGMVPAGPQPSWGEIQATPVPQQRDPMLPGPPEAPQPNLGQLLAGAQSSMKDSKSKQEPPQQPRPVAAGGGAHGSINRNTPPNYFQMPPTDPLEMRRRATLAALLSGGR